MAIATIPPKFGPADLFSVHYNDAIAQASCFFNWRGQFFSFLKKIDFLVLEKLVQILANFCCLDIGNSSF